MSKIGFIGLGRMGRPMAGNMQSKGFPLVVYDIANVAHKGFSERFLLPDHHHRVA